MKVKTWADLHGQEHLLGNGCSKHKRAPIVTDRTPGPVSHCPHLRNFHGNNPQTTWIHLPCWALVLVSAAIKRYKKCEIHSQVLLQPEHLMAFLQAIIIRIRKITTEDGSFFFFFLKHKHWLQTELFVSYEACKQWPRLTSSNFSLPWLPKWLFLVCFNGHSLMYLAANHSFRDCKYQYREENFLLHTLESDNLFISLNSYIIWIVTTHHLLQYLPCIINPHYLSSYGKIRKLIPSWVPCQEQILPLCVTDPVHTGHQGEAIVLKIWVNIPPAFRCVQQEVPWL